MSENRLPMKNTSAEKHGCLHMVVDHSPPKCRSEQRKLSER